MNPNIIHQIEVKNFGRESSFYTRGQRCVGDYKDRYIGEIKDHSVEWEDGIHVSYSVYDRNEKLIMCIENTPVIVNYQ